MSTFADLPLAAQAELAAFTLAGVASTIRNYGRAELADSLVAMATALADLAHDLNNLEDP